MNTRANATLRQAETSDARHLAELINLAGEGIPNWLWARACGDGQNPWKSGWSVPSVVAEDSLTPMR